MLKYKIPQIVTLIHAFIKITVDFLVDFGTSEHINYYYEMSSMWK